MREAVIVSWTDGQILDHIQRLAWEAHGLYADAGPVRAQERRKAHGRRVVGAKAS